MRLAWQPSRALAAVLVLLGVLGAGCVLACEMPLAVAAPVALLSIAHGAWLARRHAGRPPQALAWPLEGELMVDGQRVQAVQLHWRGPLAFLQYRDGSGRHHRLAWWPDTLDRRQRRELRLAAASAPPAPTVASMAP